MRAVVYNICEQLNDIRLLFAGMYESNRDSELQKMKDEAYNISIPTTVQDKANLKIDSINTAKDFNKGFHEKQADFAAK